MMRLLWFVCFAVVVGHVFDAVAQTRTASWDASTVKVEALHCSPNDAAGGTWSCSICASVSGSPALSACEQVEVKGTTNVNRLNALASALSQRWLNRQAFDVDAGSP